MADISKARVSNLRLGKLSVFCEMRIDSVIYVNKGSTGLWTNMPLLRFSKYCTAKNLPPLLFNYTILLLFFSFFHLVFSRQV